MNLKAVYGLQITMIYQCEPINYDKYAPQIKSITYWGSLGR